jgi:hypothetical protein
MTTTLAKPWRAVAAVAAATGALAVAPAADAGAATARLRHDGIAAKPTDVYGRYALAPARQSGAQASLFASLVQLVSTLRGESPPPDYGSLLLFGNQAIKNKPLVPSGIITLHSAGETDVAYLTNFRWQGDRRTADVLGGSTEGPVIGGFAGTIADGVVTGTLTTGQDRVALRFTRAAGQTK